ncbi:hypothetical protein C8J57DRAFT_1484414 [Mycena rebaudengoi]|nr:hypothetical protein C8J57DRAFT_1484414 [Mycena rebaudengoi]
MHYVLECDQNEACAQAEASPKATKNRQKSWSAVLAVLGDESVFILTFNPTENCQNVVKDYQKLSKDKVQVKYAEGLGRKIGGTTPSGPFWREPRAPKMLPSHTRKRKQGRRAPSLSDDTALPPFTCRIRRGAATAQTKRARQAYRTAMQRARQGKRGAVTRSRGGGLEWGRLTRAGKDGARWGTAWGEKRRCGAEVGSGGGGEHGDASMGMRTGNAAKDVHGVEDTRVWGLRPAASTLRSYREAARRRRKNRSTR